MIRPLEHCTPAEEHPERSSVEVPSPSEGEPHPGPGRGSPPVFKAGDIIDTHTGTVLPWGSFLEELSSARIIYLGETHTSFEDHRVQLEILKGIHGMDPHLAVALEMFPRESQAVLDRYAKGRISEDRFLRESDWTHIWGYPFQLYRPILSWAREEGLELIGLNAPSAIVRKVARSGLGSLTPGERRRIAADFHLDHASHRQYVQEEYQRHLKGEIKGFETFYEAQLTWEETMAETLARSLAKMPAGARIVTLIGNGHIYGRWGVPRLAEERVPHVFKTVITIPETELPEDLGPQMGDFVWVTHKQDSPQHRGRLGIMVQPEPGGGGLSILEVRPDSPAARAGILKGDVLLKIDEVRIRSVDDIHRAMRGGKGLHRFALRRSHQKIFLTLSPSD